MFCRKRLVRYFLVICLFGAHVARSWTLFQRKVRGDCQLGFEMEPLIGGPSWLKMHVKVVLQVRDENGGQSRCHKFDFVPRRATQAETMRRLMLLESVQAELRYFPPSNIAFESSCNAPPTQWPKNVPAEQYLVQQARMFCHSYANREMNLVYNNCWTFAAQLYNFILKSSEGDESIYFE
jgi:hypothetical protein